jgi:hypothetical protein
MSLNHVVLGTAQPLNAEFKSLKLDQGAVNGYVLVSDASGNASWQPAEAASIPPLTNGQLLIGQTALPHSPVPSTLSAGSGITITNAAGSITIASTGGGSSFPSITLTNTSAQIVTNGTSFTIPYPGVTTSSLTAVDGATTINGAWTFGSGTATAFNGAGITLPGTPETGVPRSIFGTYSCQTTSGVTWSGAINATALDFNITVIGRLVTLTFPALEGTGNLNVNSINSSIALPTSLWPQESSIYQTVTVMDEGNYFPVTGSSAGEGVFLVGNNGVLYMNSNGLSYEGPFAATGATGWQGFSCTYTCALSA